MSAPRTSHLNGLTKIGKYLVGRPRLIVHFKWQETPSMITGYTDSDWAGCVATARSTSGGIVCLGSHVIKTYSRQQKTIALSSAEAELHAMVANSAEVLGIIGLCRDLGMKLTGEIYADSSAALGISNRAGVGKVRHLRIQALWVQEVRSTGRLSYKKVLGTKNPSDVLTKHVPGDLLNAHLESLGMEVRGGRAEVAPTLDSVTEEIHFDWTEMKAEGDGRDRRVRFDNLLKCRGIPASGKCRPTAAARIAKTRYPRQTIATHEMGSWADETDTERGIDAIAEGDDVEGDWEIAEFDEEQFGPRKSCKEDCERRQVRGAASLAIRTPAVGPEGESFRKDLRQRVKGAGSLRKRLDGADSIVRRRSCVLCRSGFRSERRIESAKSGRLHSFAAVDSNVRVDAEGERKANCAYVHSTTHHTHDRHIVFMCDRVIVAYARCTLHMRARSEEKQHGTQHPRLQPFGLADHRLVTSLRAPKSR